jgi:hypothetical protein
MKTYPREYIERCREKIDADVAAYRTLATTAGANAGPALCELETRYFNNLALVLDACFVHRLRTVEGKDGNPLNEVRVLVNSLLLHDGVMTPESGIKLVPAKSVLQIPFGETIALTEAQFVALATAFFAEIERKFS